MIVSGRIAKMFRNQGFVNVDYLVQHRLPTNTARILNCLTKDWRRWVRPRGFEDFDPTFGKTTVGANSVGYGASKIVGSRFDGFEGGSVESITKYIGAYRYGSGIAKCAVYSVHPTTGKPYVLQAQSVELTTLTLNAWNTFDVSPDVNVLEGNKRILFWDQAEPEHKYDTGTASYGTIGGYTYPWGPWPDPWVDDTTYYPNHIYSIYLTYTTAVPAGLGGGMTLTLELIR